MKHKIKGNNYTLETNVDVFADRGTNNTDTDFSWGLVDFNLTINNKTFTNNRNNNNNTNIIKNLTINKNGKYVSNFNSKVSTKLTYNGGSIVVADNYKLYLEKELEVNGNLTIDEHFDIKGVTSIKVKEGCHLSINADLTIDQNVTLSGDIRLGSGKTLTLKGGQITFTGTTDFSHSAGNSTILIKNSATINGLTTCIGGNFVFENSIEYNSTNTCILPGNYPNLTATLTTGNSLSLCGDVEITGTLTWNNNSYIYLNEHLLSVKAISASTALSKSHMFIAGGEGTLKYMNPSNGLILHVGTESATTGKEYSPVKFVSGISGGASSYVTVQVMDTAESGHSTDLERYWTIGGSGLAEGSIGMEFTYVDPDDGLNYGDLGVWKVYHNGLKVNENATIGSNKITVTTPDINGVWTAAEPNVVTLYTCSNGNWNELTTWTTDPTGKTHVGAEIPDMNHNVVILNGFKVTTVRNETARSVKICAGAELDMGTYADGHNFMNVYGQGTLSIGAGDFPNNGNYSLFVSPDGGTTRFYGAHISNAIPHQYTYNNLILEYSGDVERKLSKNLVINGNLTLTNGSLAFTKANQSIYVGGNIDIATTGGIYVYGAGSKTQADTIVIGGNFINRGQVIMTQRSKYELDEAISAEGSDGRGIIRFVGEKNVEFNCYNTTKLSQLIIDKGTDQTYRVKLYSSNTSNFQLMGNATNFGNKGEIKPQTKPDGFTNQDNPPLILKPLWLRNGTLELTGYVEIKSLSEGGDDNFFIPLNGCLHLNGENVKVYVCINGGKGNRAFMPAGKFILDAGLFDASSGSGAVFRNTSEIYINGGTFRAAQLRPSQNVDGGKTTYVQTGGTAIFDSQGEEKAGYATFHMPFETYTFKMTGGTLKIYGAQNKTGKSTIGGSFAIKCNPENSKITGGEIIVSAVKTDWTTKHTECRMISSIPLYNLTLANEDGRGSDVYTNHTYTDFSGDVNGNPVSVEADKLYVKNNLKICSGVTFLTKTGGVLKDIEVGGDLIIESGATLIHGNNTITLNGDGSRIQQFTSDGTVKKDNGSTFGYYNLIIDDNADVQVNSDIIVRNDFTLGEGAKMRDGAANTYTLQGKNITINGTHLRPVSGAGKIEFKGDSPTISGNGNGSLNNVNVELTSGVLAINARNITINGDLRLLNSGNNSSGRVSVEGTSKLTFGPEAHIYTDEADGQDFGERKIIYTNGLSSSGGVAKVYSEDANSFLFPFGTKNGSNYYYTPALITYKKADVYGTITSMPVLGAHPLIGNASKALAYYWVTKEDGFSGVPAGDLEQNYTYQASHVRGTIGNYVPARYHNAEWKKGVTGDMHKGANNFDYNTATNASGEYTCGDPNDSFTDILKLYSSNYVTTNSNTGNWNDPRSWSIDSVNGVPNVKIGDTYYKYNGNTKYVEYNPATGDDIVPGSEIELYESEGVFNSSLPTPTATTAVRIGSASHNHTIMMTENGESCATLRIEPGSTLDLGVFTGHTFSLVEVDESAEEGAGTLKIASLGNNDLVYDGVYRGSFPSGDFVKFLGEHGGTVHYYGNTKTYYIPSVSESGLALTNYCNLIIGGDVYGHRIRIPMDIDITIYKNLIAKGFMHSAYVWNPHTVTIHGNLIVKTNSEFYMAEASANKTMNYIINGNVDVEESGSFRVSGKSKIIHNLEIGGNLNVNGTFNLSYGTIGNDAFQIATTFFGSDTSRITGNGSIKFYRVICDKGFDASSMLILQNPHVSTEHADDEAFLVLKHGTFQVDFPSDDNSIDLNTNCPLTIATPTRLSVKKGTVNVCNYDNNHELTLNGSIDVQGGVLNIGDQSKEQSNSIVYSATSTPTINVSGGQMNVNGIIRRTTGTRYGSLIYHQSGGTVVIKGNDRAVNAPDGNSAFEVMNDGSEFITTGGELIIKATDGGDRFGDVLIEPTIANCTGGSIIFDGGDEQKILSATSLHRIVVNSGSQLHVYSYPITTDSLEIANGAIFDSRGFDLTIKKGFRNQNNSNVSGIDAGGFIAGNSTQTTYFTGNNVRFGGAADNLTNFANVIVNGRLTLTDAYSDIMVNKNLTLTYGTVTDNGSDIRLIGDLENYGTFVSNESTGGLNFCGTITEQYIKGVGTGVLGSVTINNPHKLFLYTDTRIDNKLTLNAILYADIYQLTLGENATIDEAVGFDKTKMILLNGAQEDKGVRKIIHSGSSSFTIPIGVDGFYTPAKYVFTKNISGEETSLTVKTVDYLNKNLTETPTTYLKYFWVVTTEGFNEENVDKDAANGNFTVTQTYTYPDDATHLVVDASQSESDMLPEYLHTLGEYEWVNFKTGGKASLDANNNQIIFNPSFGHLEGEYTAGIVHDTIYTGLPVLYSNGTGGGNWHEKSTWKKKDENDNYIDLGPTEDIGENPVHLRGDDVVIVDADDTKSYCLYFDDVAATLDCRTKSGNDFGRVYGSGTLKIDATDKGNYMFPAGNFDKFLKYSTSTVEFGGDNNGTLPASPGNSSRPLPNVKFSGTGIKTLPAGTTEEIDGNLTIVDGATLNNTANNIKIIVRGDWTDKNTSVSGFNAGSSIVEFNGDSTQRLNVYNDNTVFPSLIINNTGTQSDSIIIGDCDTEEPINHGISVSSKLTLTKGHVHTDLNNCLVVSEPTANITGGSEDSYVDGPLGIYAIAKSNPKYPVGNDNRFASTTLNNVSVGGVWKVQYFNQQSGNEAVTATMTDPLTGVSENEYWKVYPPTGNENATANLTLRYDEQSYPQIRTAAQLKKLTMVSYPNPDKWAIIKNSGASGTVTSGTITSTEDAQTVSNKEFTLGYLGTTAKLTPGNYYVCDGNNSVEIPVTLTGTPNYTLQYTVDGGAPITIPDITSDSYKLVLSASTLGGHKHDNEGNPLPYEVRLAGVSDPSGDGNAFTNDVANVIVWYNEVPTIIGDDAVGQGDTHPYSTTTTGHNSTSYLWSWSGTGNSNATLSSTNQSSINVTFKRPGSNANTNTGTYTLSLTNTYTNSNGTTCSASSNKIVNIQKKPQPKIVADNGTFSSCYGETHTYSVSEVVNHTYLWSVTGGTITSGLKSHTCTVEWGNSGSGTITISETGQGNGTGSETKEIFFYPAAEIGTIVPPEYVCDNTRGTVTIKNTKSTLQYMVCDNNDESIVYSGYQSGTGEDLNITIDAIRTNVEIKVIAKNDGCSTESEGKPIKISPNPDITWVIGEDLYIGKPTNLHLEQTSEFNEMSYEFTNTIGSNNIAGNFPNPANDVDIELPIATTATKLEGTLRVKETSHDCFSDYKIEKEVSQDYLWNGSESNVWNTDNNWWAKTEPSTSDNVIIPSNVANMPVISSASAKAANITINSGASITLSDNTLTVYGDLTNNGEITANGGKIAFTAGNHNVTGENTFTDVDNAGNVTFNSTNTIKGDINNSGTINGNIVLNNTDKQQSITGNGSYGSVTVDNASGVTINSDITINGELTLNSGLVTVPDNKILTFGTSASANSKNANAYVIGKMKKFGSSSFTFPTGDNDHRAMVQIIPIGASSESWFTVSYSSTGNEDLANENKVEGLVRVSSIDMWDIHGDDGNGNSQKSQIKLFWDDAERSGITNDLSKLVVAHYTGSRWEIIRQDKSDDGWILSREVTSYSPFTFGSTVEEEHPLPVTFAAFAGHQEGNSIVLEWTTLSENNNDYFEIERSSDGINFVTIGYVEGAGNSNSRIDYSFNDNAPEQGRLYYRLSQVDFDGTREYADKVVTVTFANNKLAVSIVPNPTSGLFTLQNCGNSGQLVIMTQNGMVVKEFEVTNFNQQINIGDLANGIYIAKYTTDSESTILKIVKF
ncbi:MAG: T9SS type A sorting domain-containing protein [Salinivirgaceae bacterium]|nr:T9SS type A sorting domain-containing protein [Salinivirgaceae bacterium]